MEITADQIEDFRKEFASDEKNRLAQNVVAHTNPLEACMSRLALETNHHVFNHKVDETKPVTHQRSSGRCWIFAVLNAMRIPFVKGQELEDFEFSQNYLFFWDKIGKHTSELQSHHELVCPLLLEKTNH